MRINDVAVTENPFEEKKMKKNYSLSFFHPNYSLVGKNQKKSQIQTLHEIEDKLRKLSFNFSTYKISINFISNQILNDSTHLLNNLKNEDQELLQNGYESFKMFEWNETLYCYEKAFCISGIIDFIEREFEKKKDNLNSHHDQKEMTNESKSNIFLNDLFKSVLDL